MSIRILTARPHRVFPALVEEMDALYRKGEHILLLVPEQFTLAAEVELMERLKLDGMFLINVISPSRLYDHVIAAAGQDEREPLSDAGRRMAISQALERLEDKLPYYGSILHRRGFVEKLSALLTDLKRGGLTPESLKAYAESLEHGMQKDKLQDLSLVFQQYHEVLRGRFSDSEDRLTYIAGRLAQSRYLEGQHLYVYGFDTLPQQLMSLLRAAAPLCLSLTVGMSCDTPDARDAELFTPIRQGISRFAAMLREDGLKVNLQAIQNKPLSHAAPIDHLDQTLFIHPPRAYDSAPDGVYLFSELTPFDEATMMSRQVMRLMQHGIQADKIAILYPEEGGYSFAVSAALTDSGLPFYTDQQLPASAHGLVQFLLGALRAMADGWRNRDMLAVLKSGYAPFCFEEVCDLENYVRSCGIDRNRWTSVFTRGTEEQRERCEALRLRLMKPLQKARQAIVDARDAASSISAVFDMLMDVNAYETLQQEEKRLLDNGFTVRANQNSQIWQAILDLLDQMVRLGGQARIPLKHIADRMECGFSAVSLASLPPAGGMLHAGTLGHVLAEDVDVVFVLGLNDGLLNKSTDSLLSPEERARTQDETGCFLGLTDESRIQLAKWDLKRAFTLPKRFLFLSFARTTPDGAACRSLGLIETLEKYLLPGIQPSPVPEAELPLSPAQALAELGHLLRSHPDGFSVLSETWKKRMQILLRSPSTVPETMRLLRSLNTDGNAQPLTKEQAHALFGDDVLSVSRLEQFADCPFKHFMTYGLRPHVLKEWKIDPIETGTFYHAGLNQFSRLARREPDYPYISKQRIDELAREAIRPFEEEILQGPMGDGERNRARFEMATQTIRCAASVITRQLAAGRFTLYRTEAAFGYEGSMPPIVLCLSDGREISLRGRIDRIDRYDTPDSVYLRVIDYKSSQQQLDAARTWWGLQLQLLLYLDVCTSSIPNAKPAGAFYFYVANPLVESSTDVKSVVEEELRKIFHLRGIALSDVEIMEATDSQEVPHVLSPIYLANGSLKKTAKALEMDQLTALMQHAKETAVSLADQLFEGQTTICPSRDANRTACDLCNFRTVCRFDSASPEAPFRDVPGMNMEQLRESLGRNAAKEQQNSKETIAHSPGFMYNEHVDSKQHGNIL